jgi:hypothetical protein
MALIVHIHTDVHYHIHLIMRRTHVKGLMTMDIKDPDRMYYDHLPVPLHVLVDTDTTTYQVHLRYHMHVHVYPN